MHLTDEQLNEYLDNESSDHAMIEAHLETCDECATRLSDLQTLFTVLDSLPAVALSHNLREASPCNVARFPPRPSLVPQLPRWLTLTATLQAVVALGALIIAIPFISILLTKVEAPSFTRLIFELQI